ncbi:MAG: HIT family protein [Chitinophagales bacterium]
MSVFTRIVKGEIPSYKIAETADCYAFLDINPLAKGHTLVIPKKEVDYLFDLDDDLFQSLQLFAKRVSMAIKEVVTCERIGVAVIGLEVPHAHIHLVPINSIGDLNFSKPKLIVNAEEMQAIAKEIMKAYDLNN